MRVAGVDIGGTAIKLGVFDPDRGLIKTRAIGVERGDAEKTLGRIAGELNDMRVSLVGVGTAGEVNLTTGLVNAGNLKWWGVPVRKMLAARVKMPVWVDNDAQAALAAEMYDGALVGVRNAVYLTLGTGIGGALLLNGKPYRGGDNTAAELGHIITHAGGLPCACSRRGCFEMYASAAALRRMAGTGTAREAIDGARAGDPALRRAFKRYLRELALGLSSLVMVFAPERIVLGGGLSAAGDILLDGAREELKRLFAARPDQFRGDLALAKHLNDAGMLGAAALAWRAQNDNSI